MWLRKSEENVGNPALVPRKEPLAPDPERRPREPLAPGTLIGLEKHRDGDPVREIADGRRDEDRDDPAGDNRRRRPDARASKDRERNDGYDRQETDGLADEFHGREEPRRARLVAIAGDVEFRTVVGKEGHGFCGSCLRIRFRVFIRSRTWNLTKQKRPLPASHSWLVGKGRTENTERGTRAWRVLLARVVQ